MGGFATNKGPLFYQNNELNCPDCGESTLYFNEMLDIVKECDKQYDSGFKRFNKFLERYRCNNELHYFFIKKSNLNNEDESLITKLKSTGIPNHLFDNHSELIVDRKAAERERSRLKEFRDLFFKPYLDSSISDQLITEDGAFVLTISRHMIIQDPKCQHKFTENSLPIEHHKEQKKRWWGENRSLLLEELRANEGFYGAVPIMPVTLFDQNDVYTIGEHIRSILKIIFTKFGDKIKSINFYYGSANSNIRAWLFALMSLQHSSISDDDNYRHYLSKIEFWDYKFDEDNDKRRKTDSRKEPGKKILKPIWRFHPLPSLISKSSSKRIVEEE